MDSTVGMAKLGGVATAEEDTVHSDTSIFGYFWRSADFIPTIVDPRRIKWDAQALWRGERRAKKRGRRRERKEREREAAAREMDAIERHRQSHAATDAAERERLQDEARQQAVVATAAATIQRCFRQHLAHLECERARLVPSVLNLCLRLLGGDDEPEPEPGPGPCGDTEEGTPPMEAAIAERAAALTRASGQHGEGTGISLAGVLHALEHVVADRDQITAETTTSDFFKRHVLPITMPTGYSKSWPEVTDAANSYYTHHYIEDATDEERTKPDGSPDPPPNTYSLCARMAADPRTAGFIGRPTHFVSHAHTYKILELVGALKNFASALPADEAERVFFWIDGFSIDEHQGFYGEKGEDNSEQWASTFKEAVRKMGNTVMVLAPWDQPVVLTRMWCLVRESTGTLASSQLLYSLFAPCI